MIRNTVWLTLLLLVACGGGHECFLNVSGQVRSSDLCSVATDTTNHFLMNANIGVEANLVLPDVVPGTYSSTDAGAQGACRVRPDSVDIIFGPVYEATTKDPASGSYKLVITSVDDHTPPAGPDGIVARERTVHGTLDCDARPYDLSTNTAVPGGTGSVHVHATF